MGIISPVISALFLDILCMWIKPYPIRIPVQSIVALGTIICKISVRGVLMAVSINISPSINCIMYPSMLVDRGNKRIVDNVCIWGWIMKMYITLIAEPIIWGVPAYARMVSVFLKLPSPLRALERAQ